MPSQIEKKFSHYGTAVKNHRSKWTELTEWTAQWLCGTLGQRPRLRVDKNPDPNRLASFVGRLSAGFGPTKRSLDLR
jgi:hypothetical protein